MGATRIETETDAALVCAIGAAAPGCDSRAEAELYRRLAPRVRLYGLRHLRDAQAAADLTHQVLLMTIEKLRAGVLREPDKLVSFVLGTCRLVVLDLRRGAVRRDALLHRFGGQAEAEAPAATETLDRRKLAHCLERLAERERSVVILSFFSDNSAEEVGRQLGLTAMNARVIRHRALQRLRDCMGVTGDAT